MTLWLAGGVAIGLVCGWWSAPVVHASAPWRSWSAVAAAMAIVAAEILRLAGSITTLALFLGFAVGFGTHAAFRAWLAAHLVRD